MKVAIIGYSGCGKSTLAGELSERYQIPVLYLDCVFWLPGWESRKREESIEIVKKFLDENASWVIDGNYFYMEYERRMEEADRIIFMNFNRFSCLFRAFCRYFKYRGKTRDSMGEGCEEKIDLEFVWWILHAGRDRKHKERYKKVMQQYGEKCIVIKNQKQLTRLKAEIEGEGKENSNYADTKR